MADDLHAAIVRALDSFATDVTGSPAALEGRGLAALGPLFAEGLVQRHVLATGSSRDAALRRYGLESMGLR